MNIIYVEKIVMTNAFSLLICKTIFDKQRVFNAVYVFDLTS